jgi:HSP20 family protein
MLSVWRPFGDLFRDDSWAREFESAFSRTQGNSGFAPLVDVIDREGEFVLKAELPGIKPEDVDLEIHDNVLTLRGERKFEHKDERQGYHRVERRYGTFTRSFVLPEGVDAGAISAGIDQGVLTVSIPKAPTVQPRKIAVKPASGLVEKAKNLFKSGEEGTAASKEGRPS